MERDPPAHRVADERAGAVRERAHVGGARRERGWAPLGGLAVPGQVRRQRAIASAERRDRPPPALPRLGEAVEQEDDPARDELTRAIDDGLAPPTARDTYLGLRAFVDELARCGAARGLHLAGLALDAARAVAGARAADPRDLAPRRAQRRLLRARAGEGERRAGGARLHVGHGGGQLRAGGDRGARGARAAARAHRRPPARAARARRRADDRPGQALRQRRQVVLRGRRVPRHAGAAAVAAPARVPRVLDRGRRPPRARST